MGGARGVIVQSEHPFVTVSETGVALGTVSISTKSFSEELNVRILASDGNMNRKIFCILTGVSILANSASAHPGHGSQLGAGGLLHYLVEWDHRWSLVSAALIVTAVWGYNRLLSRKRKTGRR